MQAEPLVVVRAVPFAGTQSWLPQPPAAFDILQTGVAGGLE